MALTTPRTFVAAEVETASIFNTHLRDNMSWVATDAPCCRVFNSAAFSNTTSGSYATCTFDSERFDNASLHDTSSNTDRIVCPSGGAGKYLIGGGGGWASNVTGVRRVGIGVNGTTTILGLNELPSVPATAFAMAVVPSFYALAVADYVVLANYQTSGGTLSFTQTGNFSPEFWAVWQRT